ncbi:MAG: hypothetical protein GY789_22115 [Hyphomicrobiales bacterium]|nr:hypothetical protein [Hyphomicrobiales bacterium]MCP4999517.1 hypothetical protein [Hyphomicrobiales bacterium]
MDSNSVLRALMRDRVDIGIATVASSEQDSRRIPLFADAFGLVCFKQHPLAAGRSPVGWEALEGEMFLANELCGMIQAPEFQSIYGRANLHVHNVVSLLALVKVGMGVTVLPQMVVQLDPAEVVFRPIGDPRVLRHIDLLHRSTNTMSPVAEALSQHIVDTTGAILEDAELHSEVYRR